MIDAFLVRALAAGLLCAAMAGPLGAFVVWRRMAYFGEALAHSVLLGVALGFLLGLAPETAVIPLIIGIALLLAFLERWRLVPTDTLLGILAHGSLALGMLLVSYVGTLRTDLLGYLFGDVLAIGDRDLLLLGGLALLVLALLLGFWRPLLSMTVSSEIAAVEGVPVVAMRLLLVFLLAIVVAAGMRVVGILLVMALLVVPAATARPLVRSPEGMAAGAAGLGCLSVLLGMGLSWLSDLPAGPAIAVVAVLLFFLVLPLGGFRADRGEKG